MMGSSPMPPPLSRLTPVSRRNGSSRSSLHESERSLPSSSPNYPFDRMASKESLVGQATTPAAAAAATAAARGGEEEGEGDGDSAAKSMAEESALFWEVRGGGGGGGWSCVGCARECRFWALVGCALLLLLLLLLTLCVVLGCVL